MAAARQCESCGVRRRDNYCEFSRYVCGRCRQVAACQHSSAVEQTRLGIHCLALACYGTLLGICLEFWEPGDAVSRWVPPDSFFADPPSFRPPPPLFLRPPSPSFSSVGSPHDCLSLLFLPSRPCPSPADLPDAAAAFLDAPPSAPWPPFEALWQLDVLPPLPYADVDLRNAVFSFYLDSLDRGEQVDGLDFMD